MTALAVIFDWLYIYMELLFSLVVAVFLFLTTLKAINSFKLQLFIQP